jgi:two-component system sensor histidine kinase UhpB
LNSTFRIYFLIVLSSLMAYQARIAAGLKERLAVAADRNRIAMDMHDGVQGHLIALASQLELLERVAPRDGVRAAELASDCRETTRQAADELRFLVQRMRSPSMASGFVGAMKQFAHNICERHGLRLEFAVKGSEVPLEPDTENVLFRIAQEALTNVAKHAEAETVSLTVQFEPRRIALSIRDDGKGIRADLPKAGNGAGLPNIQERAAKAGGTSRIEPDPSGGTVVEAVLPISMD